jgi:hypothetical protein
LKLIIPDFILLDEVEVAATRRQYKFEFLSEGGFVMKRVEDDVILFNTATGNSHNPLVFEKNFLQICSTTNKSPKFYGWAERRSRFRLPYPFSYTLNNNDRGTPGDGSNTYGTHPFSIEIEPSGKAHGVLFFNSAPVEIVLEDGFVFG